MKPGVAAKIKTLSTAGHDAYIKDCEAESPTGAGGYPKTQAKLMAGHYDRL
ncbi:hypothetical protein HNO88_000321 [Novosphingobium chloroacetimidivorans]|uniref:Uncharacterized protein n=1 Tax=Novosphingobium chloroacetimidivorans TaxID=1428314 RepID=A0A7W7K687_9SPHN|nr:hypothetical protein [Novosphingobium chloroacetimidivorans]MBB4857024.1 hypothetical protein [Novosphingobium chloroacetimidivorans]